MIITTATRLQHFLARLDSNQQQNPAVVIIEISATGMVLLGSVLNVDVSRAVVGSRTSRPRASAPYSHPSKAGVSAAHKRANSDTHSYTRHCSEIDGRERAE